MKSVIVMTDNSRRLLEDVVKKVNGCIRLGLPLER